MIVILLQNAWAYNPERVTDDGIWAYKRWIAALRWSKTGARLSRIFDQEEHWDEHYFTNTTTAVGNCSKSKLPPDELHVTSILKEKNPETVLACGQQAEAVATKLWPGTLLCIPHPASRVLTNKLLDEAKEFLFSPSGRIALRQRRGFTERVDLDRPDGLAVPGDVRVDGRSIDELSTSSLSQA